MKKTIIISEHDLRTKYDVRHVCGDGLAYMIDGELGVIPGCDTENTDHLMLIVAPTLDGFSAEMDAILKDGTPDCLDCYDGDDLLEAARGCCFAAATQDLFERLDEREMNCEDAVNILAYEAAALWSNEPDFLHANHFPELQDVDYFLGMAREYVKERGPWFGIEWVEF